MKKQRTLRTAAVHAAAIATAGTLALGAAGSAVAETGPGSHAGATYRASPAAVPRPDLNSGPIYIQQYNSFYGGDICLDSTSGGFFSCLGSLEQMWTRQPSTNGQYKIVNGTTCLDGSPSNYGLKPCQQGNGYQKWNLVLLTDGFEWKIEQPHGSTNYCLSTYGWPGSPMTVEQCQKGDGAQKFVFPAAP